MTRTGIRSKSIKPSQGLTRPTKEKWFQASPWCGSVCGTSNKVSRLLMGIRCRAQGHIISKHANGVTIYHPSTQAQEEQIEPDEDLSDLDGDEVATRRGEEEQ